MQISFRKGLTIIAASLLVVLIKSNVAEARLSDSCTRSYVLDHEGIMTASCQNDAGGVVNSSIALGDHVGRDSNGRLQWGQPPNINYQDHCTQCRVLYDETRDSVVLQCRCPLAPVSNNVPPNRRYSVLNLEERIFVVDGELVYIAP